jgi:hypothetical protein
MVDSYNNDGLARSVFDDFELTGPAVTPSTLDDVRTAAEGTQVYLTGQTVFAGFGSSSCFYIEKADRSFGIKVTTPAGNGTPGRAEIVNIYGTVQTLNGEKQITATAVVRVTAPERLLLLWVSTFATLILQHCRQLV